MRATIPTLVALSVAALTAVPAAAATTDPCHGPEAQHLLCPNLRIGKPSELYVERYEGKLILRATSDVESRGRGPMEIRGVRDGPHSMRTKQRIYRAGGGHLDVPTGAHLHFTDVGAGYGGSYWKVHQLARFELWSVGPHHRLGHLVRTGPKLNYCLRDLERTRPGRRSPENRHYPGCNQNPFRDGVTLGTSVGWSDIYPASYDKQWIKVGRLHGCFAFKMTVDPRGLLYESNEKDNSSRRFVRLPSGSVGC
jgi:hypothetical protein